MIRCVMVVHFFVTTFFTRRRQVFFFVFRRSVTSSAARMMMLMIMCRSFLAIKNPVAVAGPGRGGRVRSTCADVTVPCGNGQVPRAARRTVRRQEWCKSFCSRNCVYLFFASVQDEKKHPACDGAGCFADRMKMLQRTQPAPDAAFKALVLRKDC